MSHLGGGGGGHTSHEWGGVGWGEGGMFHSKCVCVGGAHLTQKGGWI